ncbi:MAG: alpha/beta hydrolase [Bacteroidetes bacterium HGW-Bacteroidetes-7]|jgi:pimeloyl-ACP methyl ester carboxylesterase|nr:MAG: alpha/beta hydrolase [Bacteroidetes bacterium HGW-Bacteroidetes-7]
MEFFSTCNGLPVHISDTKKGDRAIILLHGYLETLYIWEEFATLLSEHMRVISIDIPGHGLTGSAEVNTMSFCADVVVSVMDKLEIQKAFILGHSMGGYVALEAVKGYPDRFQGLLMMNSSPFPDTEEKKADREREISVILQNKLQMIIRTTIPKIFAPSNLVKFEEKILEIKETAEVHDPEGIVASIKGMMQREDNRDFLKALKMPLLFFMGKHDGIIKEEAAAEITSIVGASKVVMLENAGHCAFIEEPQICLQKLIAFVKEN